MKFQTRYNSQKSCVLLELYLYLLYEKEIDIRLFREISELSDQYFYEIMDDFNNMIEDLNLEATMTKSLVEAPKDERIYYVFTKYNFYPTGSYEFDITNLDDEKKILYAPVIIYLMLKNRRRVTSEVLELTFPNFNRNKMSLLITSLKDIISEEIDKNELQSYILLEDY